MHIHILHINRDDLEHNYNSINRIFERECNAYDLTKFQNCWLDTVGCHYNAVQYIIIFYASLQWLRPNINQRMGAQRHPISRPVGRAMGCILWRFWRKSTVFWRHRTVYSTSQEMCTWSILCCILLWFDVLILDTLRDCFSGTGAIMDNTNALGIHDIVTTTHNTTYAYFMEHNI